jgi:hypothetical protein
MGRLYLHARPLEFADRIGCVTAAEIDIWVYQQQFIYEM